MGALYNNTQHFMGNHECIITGNRAAVETYCLAIHEYLEDSGESGTRPTSALRYIDRFIRTADGWRIEHRKAARRKLREHASKTDCGTIADAVEDQSEQRIQWA